MDTGTEWLTKELVEEFLLNDMDDDVSTSTAPPSEDVSMVRDPLIEDEATLLMKAVNSNVTLTLFGKALVQKWITKFNATKNREAVVEQYRFHACDSKNFFKEKLSDSEAPKLLLDILNKIANPQEAKENLVGGEITKHENDTLEYFGGYTLKKSMERFPESVVKSFCSDKPHGQLIPLMERKVGALLYPSEEYMLFLQHIYLKFARETSRKPSNICFDDAAKEVLNGVYFTTFVSRMKDIVDNEELDLELEKATRYITLLAVIVLSYSFTKKLFSKMRKVVEFRSTGLRGDLKRQLQS